MSGFPSWLHAVIAVLMLGLAAFVWRGCWHYLESPALRHFFHSFDPLCNRCFRERRLRAEKERQQQMIRELQAKHRFTQEVRRHV